MSATRLFPIAAQGQHTDERYTPGWLFDVLAVTFDLDPAAPPGGASHVPARRSYSLVDDGLAQPWDGLVWLNPPFSAPAPWINRWIAHANGVLLFPWSVNARWLVELLDVIDAVQLLPHIRFDHPTHTGRHVPVACALTALGDGAVVLAAAASRIDAPRLRVERKEAS